MNIATRIAFSVSLVVLIAQPLTAEWNNVKEEVIKKSCKIAPHLALICFGICRITGIGITIQSWPDDVALGIGKRNRVDYECSGNENIINFISLSGDTNEIRPMGSGSTRTPGQIILENTPNLLSNMASLFFIYHGFNGLRKEISGDIAISKQLKGWIKDILTYMSE